MVAHASAGRDRARLHQPVRMLDHALQTVACADGMTPSQVAEYAERIGLAMPAAGADRVDDNLWGRTVERPADDASQEVPDSAFKYSRHLAQTPASPAVVELSFERGTPTGINGVTMTPVELIDSLTTIAGEHGIGRFDRVKNRLDRSRSRVVYDAPAAAVLHDARRELERQSSSASVNQFAPVIGTAYAGVLGRGEWFDRLRPGLDAYVLSTQERVTGTVRVKLFKGASRIVGRTVSA